MGGIGDNLMASSVLPLLAQKYRIEVISNPPHCEVFENNPNIDKLTVYGRHDLPAGGLEWQQWFRQRATEYAGLVNLSHSCETSLALVQSQTQFYWPAAWRRAHCDHNYLEYIHDIVGVPHTFAPQFFPTDSEVAKARRDTRENCGGRFIAWCLSGSRIDKVFAEAPMVISRILKETGATVCMFGAPGRDFEMAQTIHEFVKRQNSTDAGLHLCMSPDPAKPSWPIRRMLTMILQADMVIGPDTGAMWAVAMADMPKIMLLSHASPNNITKHWKNTTTLHADQKRVPCWPCHQLHDDPSTCKPNADNRAAACISDISVELLVSTIKGLLKESAQ